jgi:large conductance mechanosensitive channel
MRKENNMGKLLSEFREFALRGNVMDMAVGIIIGVAFGGVVSSFVGDVLTPPIGLLIGNVDFSDLAVVLRPATEANPAVTVNYGRFLQTLFDFLIVALAIFLVIRVMNRLKRKEDVKEAAAPPPPSGEERLLAEIRDLLKQGR